MTGTVDRSTGGGASGTSATGSEPGGAGRRARSTALVAALAALPLAFLAVVFVLPLVTILDTGLRPDGRWDVGSLGEVLGDGPLREVVWFTTWQAAASTALTLAIGLPGAWAFSRLRWRGREVAWALLLVPFVLPTVVVGSAFLQLLGPDGPVNAVAQGLGLSSEGAPAVTARGSVWALLAAHVFFNVAVVIRTVGGAWRRLDPATEQAAAVLGASRRRVAREVTLPLLAPSIVAAASLVALFTFTSFGVVLLLGGGGSLRTLEVEIFTRTRSLDLSTAASLALVQLVAVVALLVVTARLQQRWSRALAVVPSRAGAHRPRGAERWALAAILATLGVLLVAPVGALVVRSLRSAGTWSLDAYRALGERAEGSVLFVSPAEAAWSSLTAAALATAIALVVGGLATAAIITAERHRPAGRAQRSRRPRSAGLLDAAVMLPLGTSAVTIGFGFVIALDEPPLDLRGSPWLVPLAQALVAVPFVVRSLLPAARAIDPRLREAAAVLGAAPGRLWRVVDAPLLVRPLAGAAAFAFAVTVGEFGATVFVARTDSPTLPVVIERLLGQPGSSNVGQAMAAATILAAVTAAVVAATELARGEERRGS